MCNPIDAIRLKYASIHTLLVGLLVVLLYPKIVLGVFGVGIRTW